MKLTRIVFSTGIILAVMLTGGFAGSDEDSVPPEKLYRAAVEQIDDLGRDGFWQAADLLERIGCEDVEILEKGLEETDEYLKVASARAIIRIFADVKGSEAQEYISGSEDVLWKIIKDNDAEIYARELALNIIAECGNKSNGKKMIDFAENAFEPELSIAAVYSAYKLTGMLKGKKMLEESLKSDRLDIRAAAAVALADMGDISMAGEVLGKLKSEPTVRGLLANKMLENEELMRRLEKVITGGPDKERMDFLERRYEETHKKAKKAIALANSRLKEIEKLQEKIKELLESGGGSPDPGPGPGPGPGPS